MSAADVKGYLWSLIPRGFRSGDDSETDAQLGWLAEMWELARTGALAARRTWFPETAPDELLDLHGTQRRVPRHPGESAESYRARLIAAWPVRALSGTKLGVELAVQTLGYPGATVWECYREGPAARFNGVYLYDGSIRYGGDAQAFRFDVRVPVDAVTGPAMPASAWALIVREVARTKRAAAMLRWLVAELATDADAAPRPTDAPMDVTTTTFHLYDGSIDFDGSHTYGATTEETQTC